jgi:hypothetical protein
MKLRDVRCEAMIKPRKRSVEKEVAAANPPVVGKVKWRTALKDGRNSGGLNNVREMRMHKLIVKKFENKGES